MLRRMSGIGTRFLTERQLQKMCFVNSGEEMLVDFASHQLEQDLGGGRPPVTEFFPFPLYAGPFDAGSTVGVNRSAIPNVHLAFTAAGMRGQAWNPGLSREDNVAVEFTELAEDIFKRCGLSVPSSCPRRTPLTESTSVRKSGSPAAPEYGVKDEGQSDSTCVNEPSDVSSSACDSNRQAHDRLTPGSKLGDKATEAAQRQLSAAGCTDPLDKARHLLASAALSGSLQLATEATFVQSGQTNKAAVTNASLSGDLARKLQTQVSEQVRLESAVSQARLEPVFDDGEVRPRSIFSCIPQCGTSCK